MAPKKPQSAEFQVISFEDSGKVREYRKRKFHKKTNLGCLACRSKRVKVCGTST
jgi:hypothetical protein